MNQKILESESVQSAISGIEQVEQRIDRHLDIPEEVYTIDIVRFEYDDSEGGLKIPNGGEYKKVKLFSREEDLCIFDGTQIFSFPKREMAGIYVFNRALSMMNWNKDQRPFEKVFRDSGVAGTGSLYYCCSLILNRSGETYCLLFPAYELNVIQKLTGLQAPDFSFLFIPPKKEKAHPEFYWLPPRGDVKRLLSLNEDFELTAEHPGLVLGLGGLILLSIMIPMMVFLCVAFAINDEVGLGPGIIGLLGGFTISAGLINIIQAWLHEYLGHIVTLACFACGSALMIVGWIMI
ncbi:MAG: hypothetical protein IKG59_02505, partial [Firmicutes bacterium]|nr:hypothetical protein [Bacillota bacterium]